MRKIHRWLSVIFGVVILFIATTGLMSQFAALVANGGFEEERASPRTAASAGNLLIPAAQAQEQEEQVPAPTAFTCPADMTCRPKAPQSAARAWVGYLHHLHSGEEFGPAGVVISIISGFALLFFAFSGLWMYIQMFRRRAHRASHPRRIFW